MSSLSDSEISEIIEGLHDRFAREAFEFDDIVEIGIYPVHLVPYKRHLSRKRGQREFNCYPIAYWPDIDIRAIDDYSHACYEHFSVQEKNIMRNTLEGHSIVIFPVILSDNVDSVAISHIQRFHVEHGDGIEFPAIFDLDLDMVYMRRTNPGVGDPFFDPYRGEIEFMLKG